MDCIENNSFRKLIASQYLSMLLINCEWICDMVLVCVIILISSLDLRLLKIESEFREETHKWRSSFSHWRTVW